MFGRKRTPPPPPAGPSGPVLDGAVRVFRSAEHLVAWLGSVEGRPAMVRAVTPRHVGDLSVALARLAGDRHGGAVLVLGPQGPEQRGWLDDARLEHGADAITGPWPVRVQGEAGLLVGVTPSEPPSTWEEWEPDAWPVRAAADAPLDAQRVQIFMRAQTFARPVGTSEADHESEVLARAGVRRWFRGRLVPTIAGLVAFGQTTERYLPGAAVAIRWPGRTEQLHQGALPWLVRRLTEERSLWGAVPLEVAAQIVVLALAERSWAGPDARTPITVSVKASGLELAIPTRAANRREQEDRAPGNPRLRQFLVRLGLLVAGPGGDIPDNDEVLAEIGRRYPGIRHRFDDDATWFEVPWRPGVPEVRREARAPATPAMTRVEASRTAPGGPASSEPGAGAPEPSAPSTTAPAVLSTTTPPESVPPRPASSPPGRPRPTPPRSAPVFHPRPPAPPIVHVAGLPAAPPQAATPPPEPRLSVPPPAPSPPHPPVVASVSLPPVYAVPTPPPPTGPLSQDERRAQLRALFLASDRPIALRELAESLGVHRDTLQPALKALIAEGWLAPTDPNPRSPVQRYRRTGD